MSLSSADLILMLVVTGMATATAYLHSPRAKSLVYMLPLPFSAGVISSGQPVDGTHVLAIALVWTYPWIVWALHTRMRTNILLADLAALAVYLAAGFAVARLVPATGPASVWIFWTALALLLVSSTLLLTVPLRDEPGHRSPLPIWVKSPMILLVVASVILLKHPLRGFMPCFPFVTIFAVYESRRSLHTLAARMPVFVVGICPMLAVYHSLSPSLGPLAALAAGWVTYLPIYLLLDRFYQRRQPAAPPQRSVESH